MSVMNYFPAVNLYLVFNTNKAFVHQQGSCDFLLFCCVFHLCVSVNLVTMDAHRKDCNSGSSPMSYFRSGIDNHIEQKCWYFFFSFPF